MAQILDGKKIAAEVRSEVAERNLALASRMDRPACLALLLVGENPASQIYVRSKVKACAQAGIRSIVLELPSETSESAILATVNEWSNDPDIDGILVQLPLPKHVGEAKVLLAIAPDKDVDGFHPINVGRLVAGVPGFVPCTPAGVMEMLRRYEITLAGKHAVVLGRSNIVGKPIANLLYQKNRTANAAVTIVHTGVPDHGTYTKQADLIVAAVGVPQLIRAEHVKEGAIVVDVGINRVEDQTTATGYRVVGDVHFQELEPKASYITPVPGGVGPMTIAMLLSNTVLAAEWRLK